MFRAYPLRTRAPGKSGQHRLGVEVAGAHRMPARPRYWLVRVGEDGSAAPLPPLPVQAREQGVAAYYRIDEFRVARTHQHPPFTEPEKAPADG